MQFEMNLKLPEAEFRKQIDNLINNARKAETVLPLPCHIDGAPMEIAALILSQIDCSDCDARCCRSPKYAEFGIPFLSTEYLALVDRIGVEKLAKIDIKLIGNSRYMPTPCPFLHKKTCSIYDIRPVVCVLYPFDPSAVDGQGDIMVSLDPLCPEARRIAKRAYSMLWKLYNKMQEAYAQRDELKKGSQQEQILRFVKRTQV